MTTFLSTFAALASVATAFWSPGLAALILAVPVVLLLLTLVALRSKKWKAIPELSPQANAMMQSFGHFYAKPRAGARYSATASLTLLCCIGVGAIASFKLAWWVLSVAVPGFLLMAYVARSFNPASFLTDEGERHAHEELVAYLKARDL